MVRRTTQQVTDLAFLSLQRRVAAKLLELAGPDGTRTLRLTRASSPPWSAAPASR
jgi:hypothetical protein